MQNHILQLLQQHGFVVEESGCWIGLPAVQGPVAPARRKKAGYKPYAGLCNVQLYDKYLHLLHQLKLRSGTTTPSVDDAYPRWHILPQL